MLERHSGYVVLTKHLDTTKAATITKDRFPGITMVDTATRHHAERHSGGLGRRRHQRQGDGAAGLEYAYNKLLAGSAGSETLLQTPFGVSLPQGGKLKTKPAVAGAGIELTLDQPLQFVTEQALAAEISATRARRAPRSSLDTRTGQILSMANLVSTTQKDAQLAGPLASTASTGIAGIAQAQNNLAVTQTYEPGSVFKIVPFSAALAAGQISPTTQFSVPGQVLIDGPCSTMPSTTGLETLTATQILAQSSNIGTYEIANQVGETGLLAQVERLGFGQPTGLNFPGESAGLS